MAMFIQSKADSAKNTSPVKTEKKDLSFTKDYMNDTPLSIVQFQITRLSL